jgi:DNA-binding GntR family transcriptional regulator
VQHARGQSYELRTVVARAGLRAYGLHADPPQLAPIRRAHGRVHAASGRSTGPAAWFRIDSAVHETLAACLGNRLLADPVGRQNDLRRMQEHARRRRASGRPHRAVLPRAHGDPEVGDVEWAEALLRQAPDFSLPRQGHMSTPYSQGDRLHGPR